MQDFPKIIIKTSRNISSVIIAKPQVCCVVIPSLVSLFLLDVGIYYVEMLTRMNLHKHLYCFTEK